MTAEFKENYICPLRKDFISFERVDEHGNRQPYAGLLFEIHDRQGEVYVGKLNPLGKRKVENIFCDPAVIRIDRPYQGSESWYKDLTQRKFFPLVITALQYAAESSPAGPMKNGKTYQAQNRATAENAKFYRVEVRDLVEVGCNLPDTDTQLAPKPPVTFKLAADVAAEAPFVGLEPNRHMKTLITYKRPVTAPSTFYGIVGVSALALLLTGCATPYIRNADMLPGPDTFTFAGDLPKDFGITAKARYRSPAPKNCQIHDISLQREVTRRFGKNWIAPISSQLQHFSFAIPLNYKSGLCEMKFSGMDLEIDGKYGEQDWQTSYGRGGFLIVKDLPKDAPQFDESGMLNVATECSWLFQTSNARSRRGEIEKLLRCTGAGAYLEHDQLTDKTIRMAVGINSEEKPSFKGGWVNFPAGWKPCLGRGPDDMFRFCYNSPGVFKEFKMSGRICTIYPGCTESNRAQP